VTVPYEAPERPDLFLNTYELSADSCVELILGLLKRRGIIPE
jgi:adenylylsulfate kinase-like enzyme